MSEAFNPRHLTPDASINRVVLVDIPGAAIDAGIRGQSAFDLVGSQALFEMIRTHADDLQIAPEYVTVSNVEAFVWFDHCLESRDDTVRQTAQRIARRYGRNPGYVLLALRRMDVRREHRPDWDGWYRQRWWTLPRLWPGGGLIRGHLRDNLVHDILSIFIETQTIPPALMLDTYGAYLPLVGAACCVPADFVSAAVLDFGSTDVKRACAIYRRDMLAELHPFPPVPAGWNNRLDDTTALQEFIAFMAEVIAETCSLITSPAPVIPVSLAAYMDREGQPYEHKGTIYAALRQVTNNLQRTLANKVCQMTGRNVQIRLIHDGTAAATAHPGDTVMTLGTAIGIGYAPAVLNPLQLAPDFRINL